MSPWLKRPENESNLSPLSITNVIGDTVLVSSLHAFTACTWKNFIMCTNYISLILHPAFFYPFTFTLLLHFYLIFVWSLPYYLFLISNVLLGQKIVNIYPDTWKKKRQKKKPLASHKFFWTQSSLQFTVPVSTQASPFKKSQQHCSSYCCYWHWEIPNTPGSCRPSITSVLHMSWWHLHAASAVPSCQCQRRVCSIVINPPLLPQALLNYDGCWED